MKKSTSGNEEYRGLPTTVSATFDNFGLLESLVEKLAYRKAGFHVPAVPAESGWEMIETSHVEAYVNGNFMFSENGRFVSMPFISCFSFTCVRNHDGIDHLAWSNSLS
jgi:hypothetical protein